MPGGVPYGWSRCRLHHVLPTTAKFQPILSNTIVTIGKILCYEWVQIRSGRGSDRLTRAPTAKISPGNSGARSSRFHT